MTTYKLKFLRAALSEWRKLDTRIQLKLKTMLRERLESPYNQVKPLRGYDNLFPIRLEASGHCLVYQLINGEMIVLLIAGPD